MTKLLEKRQNQRVPTKDIVVIYHANCSDGFGGAYAAWKKFGSKAEYIPVWHAVPPPPGLQDKELYMIDFVYPEPYTKQLMKQNKRVTAIDHHVTAKAVTEMTEKYSYALEHSGAVLAWNYFHPGKKVPVLLKHIEDMDLWKFKLPRTKEIFSFLDLFNFEFKVWDKFAKDFENPAKRKKHIETGKLILMHENILIDRSVAKDAEKVFFEGHKTLAVNSSNFQSGIGERLYTKQPPMAIIWQQRGGAIKVSMRSDRTVDVSKIAQKYGGGGHKGSASFVWPLGKKLPWTYGW